MKHKKWLFISVLVAVILAFAIFYSIKIKPHTIKVREETLISDKIDNNLDGLLIAYFSDLHFGNNITEKDISTIKEKINKFNPDIVIFGGDLVNNGSSANNSLKDFLESLKAVEGKYAVLGDEDVDNEKTKELLTNAGFEILSNKNKKIYRNDSFINLVGINPSNSDSNISSAFDGINKDYYTIAVSHYPDLANSIDTSSVDYILSGHSLKGPIYIPLINLLYRPEGATKYFKGKTKINNAILDISSGLGTKTKDVRLFSDCEIVIYKLKSTS